MDAVSSRNCAMTVQFPAATSWSSLIYNDINAKTTAAINEDTAMVYSAVRDLVMMVCLIEWVPLMGGTHLKTQKLMMFQARSSQSVTAGETTMLSIS